MDTRAGRRLRRVPARAVARGDPGDPHAFSGLALQGHNVEPNTITNYRGRTAMAYVVGEAVGSDGVTYGLEVDIRAFMGEYVAGNGSTNRGSFALV